MIFWEFFKTQLKLVYRNKAGLFWTLAVPIGIYLAASLLPIGNILDMGEDYPRFLLPGLIAMVVMQGGTYTLAYAMVELKARNVLKRFAVTPLSKSQFISSLVAARLVLVIAQVVAITVIGTLVFDISFTWDILTIAVLVVLGGAIFLLLGLLISTFADTYESAAPITAAVGLTMLFLGKVFYPTDTFPKALQVVSDFLPITYMADGLRKTYTLGYGLEELSGHILALAAWFLVLFVLAVWRFRLQD
jgi:ABC-2 type transport system permease protein